MRNFHNDSPSDPVTSGFMGVSTAANASLSASATDGERLSLRVVWQLFWQQKKWFVAVALLGALLGLLLNGLMTPYFRAVTTLQIEAPSALETDSGGQVITSNAGAFNPAIHTQYEQLKRRELAQRIIAQLKLEKRLFAHDFSSPLRTLLFDWLPAGLVQKTKSPSSTVDGIDRFLAQLQVAPIERTYLVQVSYEAPDALLSAEIVNALVATFVAEQRAKQQVKIKAQTSLQREVLEARDRMVASEEALTESVRVTAGMLATSDVQKRAEERRIELNVALLAAEQKAEEISSKLQQSESSPETLLLTHPQLAPLKQQLNALETQYLTQLKIFKPAYPDMQQLALEIKKLKRKLATETNALQQARADTLQAESSVAGAEVVRLRAELADYRELEVSAADEPGRRMADAALQRELETRRQQYESLLQRHTAVSVAAGASTPTVSVIDFAQPPTQSIRPNKLANILTGLLAGLLLTAAFVLLRACVRNTLSPAAELERYSGLPVLGTVPYVRRARQAALPLAALRDVGSAVAEAYRMAATNLKFALRPPGSRIVLVTSIDPAVGKSTSVVNLALSNAQLGHKVLLIDADLRRPTIHKKMELNNHVGLGEYLYGDIELVHATQSYSDASNIYVITAGKINLDPVEALACQRMLSLIKMSRQYFDVVIIDAPPVTGFADPILLTAYADGTVLVTDEARIDPAKLTDTLTRLRRAKDNVLGFLVLKSRKAAVADAYYQRYQRRPVGDEVSVIDQPRGGLNLAR